MRAGAGRCIERRQDVVLVGETDPLACAVEHVHVGAAAQGAGGERRSDVAGIERNCVARLVDIDNHALPMPGEYCQSSVGCSGPRMNATLFSLGLNVATPQWAPFCER